VGLTIYLHQTAFFPGDLGFTHFWQSLANPALTAVMKGITYLFGDWRAALLTGIGTVYFAFKVGLAEGVMVALAGSLTLINFLLKLLIARPRPSSSLVDVMVVETNYSYPSSHACFAILFLGITIYLLNRDLRPGLLKRSLRVFLGALILVVGLTRVYLGVHWYSDMLAGFLFGGLLLSLLILGYAKWKPSHPAE
jgi:membrane-associated phospholipid phosphatase